MTETISIITAQPPLPTLATPTVISSAPAASSLTGKAVAKGIVTCLGSMDSIVFNMLMGILLPQFNGTSWHNWAGIFQALLTLRKVEDVFSLHTKPSQVSNQDWDSV